MAHSNPHRRRFRRTGPSDRLRLTPKSRGSARPASSTGPEGKQAQRPPASPAETNEPDLDVADLQQPELPTARTEPAAEAMGADTSSPEAVAADTSDCAAAPAIPEPSEPSDARITALLEEISELRLSAATHLTVAAAAMDAGRPDIAAELIGAQQRDVARLRSRAEELLGVEGETAEEARRSVAHAAVLEESTLLASARTPATKSLRRTPRNGSSPGGVAVLPRRADVYRASHWSATGALLSIAVALLFALVRPFAPHAPVASPQQISASVVASLDANVSRSYDELQQTASPKTPATDVEAATARLHADLQRLLPMAATDPAAAQRVLDVLRAERKLLAEHAPDALAAYVPEAVRIVTQLQQTASPSVLAILPPVESVVPQATAASDSLPAAPKPAPNPVPPAAPTEGGSSGGSVSAPTSSGSGTDAPAAPAPVVQLPDTPLPPVIPPTSNGGSGTGGTDSSSSGSASQSTGDGSDSTNLPLPLPQLPAPLVVDPATS